MICSKGHRLELNLGRCGKDSKSKVRKKGLKKWAFKFKTKLRNRNSLFYIQIRNIRKQLPSV